MKQRSNSTRKIGLRGKAIGTMTGALAVMMLFVGLTVYYQVVKQLEQSTAALAQELVRGVTSESLYNLMFDQVEPEARKLKKFIHENEDLAYIIVLKNKPGQAAPSGRAPSVFAAQFRDQGWPLDLDSLVALHLAHQDGPIERPDFIGVSKKHQLGGMMDVEKVDPEDQAIAGKDREELDQEAFVYGELEEPEPLVDAAKNAFVPESESKSENQWVYVLLGLKTTQIQAQKAKILWTLAIALLFAMAIFTGFIYWAATKIYHRLLVMMSVAQQISEGDLSESIPVASSDEIGRLADAINRIARNLNEMIRNLAGVTDGLSSATERITANTEEVVLGAEYQVASVDETSSSITEMVISLKGLAENVEILASSAEESSSSIMEMAATNDEVADNINSLASSVEQTTTSIEHMTEAIKEVAKSVEDLSATTEHTSASMREMDVSIGQVESNANETALLSDEVRRDAEQGSESVKQTIQGISRISDSTRMAFSAMEALGTKVQAIGQVLSVIDDVAEQTNLLALNAAIIAAQAGEHGKGFAVVADEIKDLAERTATSTNEISELILAVLSETKSVISAMENSRSSVAEGVTLSKDAEKALSKILESSTKSTHMVREIARATVEQARGSKVVTDAISRIAETVQQIASATAEQAKGSEQIMNSAERMKVITQHVHSSSQEQTRGSKQITGAIENISEMVHHLNRAQKEQASGSEQVMHAIEKIKEVAEHHSESMGNMKKTVDSMAQQSESLRTEMKRFKL